VASSTGAVVDEPAQLNSTSTAPVLLGQAADGGLVEDVELVGADPVDAVQRESLPASTSVAQTVAPSWQTHAPSQRRSPAPPP
jgi:hypothetical protein